MGKWKSLVGRFAGVAVLTAVVIVVLWAAYLRSAVLDTHAPVMGVVSTAAEDERREMQTRLLEQAAEADGFEVLSMPVERTQEAQIEAIRALIAYQVDVIVFTPIVESGWEHVLREAKALNVPLIAVDSAVRCSENNQTVSYVGFDYAALAVETMRAILRQNPPHRGVLELYGTLGDSSAREIARGCREAFVPANLEVTYSLCGDGMRSRGYEILEGLGDRLNEIGCIVAHNDAMALGAIDYLLEHDRVPGRDVLVCSFGGGADIRALLENGSIQVIAALDDAELAAMTVSAAREAAQFPDIQLDRCAPAKVLEGGAADVHS